MGIVYYTKEGLKKLKDRLHHLEAEERPKTTEAIAEARAKGDLSENAEYQIAKERQGLMEMEIGELRTVIANARVLDPKQVNTDQVGILTQVGVENKATKRKHTYTLVAEKEADVKEGKISITSPIGRGLLGKKIGDTVVVHAPSGPITYEILSITS